VVESLVHAGIGGNVCGLKLPMLDQRALPPGAQPVPVGLVIIALVCGQRLKPFQIPLRKLRPNLRVMLAGGGDVEVQHGLRRKI